MKLVALSLLLFSLFSGLSQETEVIVKPFEDFTISYNELLEQPNWVSYTIPKGIHKIVYERPEMDFFTNDSIHTSDDADYFRNKWDKGHALPNRHVSYDPEKQVASFTYLNCWLQHWRLNRVAINALEKHIFEDLEGHRSIRIEAIFTPDSKVLETGATVPDGFIWEVEYDGGKKVYKFENKSDGNFWDNRL